MKNATQFESKGAKLKFRNALNHHKEAMKHVKSRLDSKTPASYEFKAAVSSPTQKMNTVETDIAKNNLNLANRIFNIMEGPGIISDILKSNVHPTKHPGTMNFKIRLKEAHRIHKQNMTMATRLDSVRAHYRTMVAPKAAVVEKKAVKLQPPNFIPKLKLANIFQHEEESNEYEFFEEDDGRSTSCRSEKNSNNRVVKLGRKQVSRSARGPESSSSRDKNSSGKRTKRTMKPKQSSPTPVTNTNNRNQNVLLEYSKIQDGHVLDVAVIKEPFQDRYAIFGIDIDNGQRYELRLSSDDVSRVLDGDILVTSVDNIEVWMALLNKVRLAPVGAFTKLPSVGDAPPIDTNEISSNNTTTRIHMKPTNTIGGGIEEDIYEDDYVQEEGEQVQESHTQIQYTGTQDGSTSSGNNMSESAVAAVVEVIEPKAPDSARPSTRPGGRGSRQSSAKGTVKPTTAPSNTNNTSIPTSALTSTEIPIVTEHTGDGAGDSVGSHLFESSLLGNKGEDNEGSGAESYIEPKATTSQMASKPLGSAEKGPPRAHRVLSSKKSATPTKEL